MARASRSAVTRTAPSCTPAMVTRARSARQVSLGPSTGELNGTTRTMAGGSETARVMLREMARLRSPQGAHSEVEPHNAQRNGEDRYYGQSICLPPDWNTIDENATFQQFSPEFQLAP